MEEYIKNLKILVDKNNIFKPGLFSGNMGLCFSLYLINKITHDEEFEMMADNLLDKVINSIITMKDSSFANGLCGIGWAINYLHMNKCIEGNIDDVLYNIDAIIYRKMHNHQEAINADFENGIIGYLTYIVFRLMNDSRKEENLQKQLNEATLRAIVDKIELVIPNRIPMLSKDLYPTILWEFPILFYCLGKTLRLGIYKEKICSMYGEWSYLLTCILPYLNINRLAIANSLAYSNSVVRNQSIGSYIETLFYSVNYNSYIHEIRKDSVALCGDWFYAILNSYMAMNLMGRRHVRYSGLENTHKKILDLYNRKIEGVLYDIGEAHPDITFINGYSGSLLSYCLINNDFTNDDDKILI